MAPSNNGRGSVPAIVVMRAQGLSSSLRLVFVSRFLGIGEGLDFDVNTPHL